VERLLPARTAEERADLATRLFDKASDATGDEADADPWKQDYRSPQQHDRDRLIYSAALARLAYVTQVTAPESGYIFHNRLTHSLKVAQVGRRNAERLRRLAENKHITGAAATLVESLDPDAVEASCLAHDLGHPPFGHIAEEVLKRQSRSGIPGDLFEGNAQSFRIVTHLASRGTGSGLNLTRQTLDGLLKYPWRHRDPDPSPKGTRKRKWGYYQADSEAYEFARKYTGGELPKQYPVQSLEATLMDWADNVTYAVHDVDDFFRAGLVPLDRLADPLSDELREFERLLKDAHDADPAALGEYEIGQLREAAGRIISAEGPIAPYRDTKDARRAMRQFGSALISRYLGGFTLHDDPASGKVKLCIDPGLECEVAALKLVAWVYVVRRPGLAVVQHGQKRVMQDLFTWYFEGSAGGPTGDRRLFPPGVKAQLDAGPDEAPHRARVVVDFLSGLTEDAAIQLHRRLSGGWTAPTLDATAQMG
jgi:dGTPase